MADVADDKTYEVTLATAVQLGPTLLRPRDRVVLKGSVIKKLGDAVVKATEIKKDVDAEAIAAANEKAAPAPTKKGK